MMQAAAASAATWPAVLAGAATTSPATGSFTPVPPGLADAVAIPQEYVWNVLIRWGESLRAGVPDLDTGSLASGGLLAEGAAARQAQQFGAHCDAIQYFRLDRGAGSAPSRAGILCVNNEYTNDEQLFPDRKAVFGTDPEHIREFVTRHPGSVPLAKAAHGISVVEIGRPDSRWQYRRDSRFNRRVTADSVIELRGPARGSSWMRTSQDPSGTQVKGTFANCAGGRTPWGTYLSAEENIQDYFGNWRALRATTGEAAIAVDAHRRFRHWGSVSPHGWELIDPRFDMLREPNEAFRFGWIVELDPMNPAAVPVKRTALGRMAHEAATPTLAPDGRVVVYMGDDDTFEYIYKYVSTDRYMPGNGGLNGTLLDRGTLYVARFDADGGGEWLPLVHDARGPLNAATGFRDQAEVLVRARAAGDVLGATPMDRPEDIEVHPVTGRVYVACTRNELRSAAAGRREFGGRIVDHAPNAANPRNRNLFGHIIEITEAGDDHAGARFRWNAWLMGDTGRTGETSLGSPDNLGFDDRGRLWIVTDGEQPDGSNNGCFVCDSTSDGTMQPRRFMLGPRGAEIAGCCFAPGCDTLFLSIQHPGEGGTVEQPRSDWPDGGGRPPRSAVIAIRRKDGGPV
jgi:secreted PhoX family phosphatase